MISYYGDFAEDDTVLIPFNTFSSNDPSASITITNLVDADIKVHKDGGVTPIAVDGATIAIDYASITGNHLITIDTSAHADYAVGSEYSVRIEGTTVDGATINAWVGSFSIERAGGALALLKGTNSLANIEDKIDIIDTNVDQIETAVITNAAGVDIAADIISVKSTVDNNESGIGIIVQDTADMQPRVVAIEVDTSTTLQGELDGIQADTEDIQSRLPAALVNSRMDSTIDATGFEQGAIDNVWDEVLTGASHNVANSSGKRLRQIQEAFVVAEGTAEAGTATTITLEAGAVSVVDDIYRGDRIVITAGTGVGEHGLVTAYNGTTRVATMAETWVITPSTDSVYEISPASVDIETIQHVVQTGGDLAEAVITNAAGVDVAADIIAIKAETALIVADTNELQGDDVPGLIAALNDLAGSDVLTQVNTALDTAIAELGVAAPSATPSLRTGLMLLYMMARNKLVVQTSGTDALEIYNNAGTKITLKLLSDDGADYTEAEMS